MCRAALRAAGAAIGARAGFACGCGVGGAAGGAGGSVIPIAGTAAGAAAGCGAGGTVGALAGAGLGALAGDKAADLVCEDDEPDCTRASAFHLAAAKIFDPEEFKRDYVGGGGGRFDICACKDGTIILKAVGQCDSPGPGIKTHAKWK